MFLKSAGSLKSLNLKLMAGVVLISVAVIASSGFGSRMTGRARGTQHWSEPELFSESLRVVSDDNSRPIGSDSSASVRREFIVGRDFSLAAINAGRLGKDPYATKHLIVDLVYLIDRLEGRSEGERLRAVLTDVVRGNLASEKVGSDLRVQMDRHASRLKGADRWHFELGFTSLHLSLASYNNSESAVTEDLATLKTLASAAPKGVSEDLIQRLSAVTGFGDSERIGDEEFERIFYATRNLLELFGG